MSRARRGQGLWLPTALVAVCLAILVSLGNWQRHRLAWKEALIATLDKRLAAAPEPLPPARAWADLTPADEFRRVAATVTFANDKEGLVYTSGSSLRRDVDGPGYWVFTPARLADGAMVMIDRGFVPEGRQSPDRRRDGQLSGPVAITGVLRWPEAPGLFTPAADLKANVWFARDAESIAAAKGERSAAPFYIDQEGPLPPGGWPRPGPLHPGLPNSHFGYMLTWYGLAVALLGVYVAWLIGRLRRPGGPAAADDVVTDRRP